jgi:hypothetical protein
MLLGFFCAALPDAFAEVVGRTLPLSPMMRLRLPLFTGMKASLLLCLALAPLPLRANALNQEAAPQGASHLQPASARWANLETAEPPSFRRHVIPLMSRLGCSGRECHGSFSGQGGFQLSLFGYDFEKDHREITADEEDGIRVEKKEPLTSLILTKPALDGEKHKGKKIIEKGSWEYNLILKWIMEGAKLDVAETGDFGRLEVLPKELVFKKAGEAIQLQVLAHWKDGTVEDVTQVTRFRTNDESVAEVSAVGLVTSKEKGDTHIVAFYDNGVEPVPAMLPVSSQPFPTVQTRTKVDELVVEKLRKAGIVPSELATDTEFLRRASLDVTGTLPAPQEIEAFAADQSADKRAKKIDELLARPGYAAWWTTKFCDFTGNNPKQMNNIFAVGKNLSAQMSRQWYDWIYKRVSENQPYDQFAAGIILATGRTSPTQTYAEYVAEMGSYYRHENPADFADRPNLPFYWQRKNVTKPEEKSLAFAHTFLGVRIECAECHKHPFDQWTKTDFAQFKEFFTPLASGSRNEGGMKKAAAPAMKEKAAVGKAAADQPAGEKVAEAAPAEEAVKPPITFASLTKEIRDIVAAKLEGKEDNKKGKDPVKAGQDNEVNRRITAGEPVPWTELYANIRPPGTQAQRNKQQQDKVQGNSRVITPKILGGEEVVLQQYSDPREPLMNWLRDKENPYFARAFVNRVWASYFHRGIVEPADDLNLANPPVNEPLMNYLATGFIAHGYDMKWLHREILTSDTYQRSWKTNETNKLDEKNFSHAVIRRLPAETVSDAITMATANSAKVAKFATDISDRAIGPIGNSALGGQGGGGGKNADGYALGIFGKPARQANCDCERTTDPTLLQTIYTRNDPNIISRIEPAGNAWIDELRKSAQVSGASGPEGIRKRIQLNEQKLASLTPPEKPTSAQPDETEKYERRLKKNEEARQETEKGIAGLKKTLAELEANPPKAFNADAAIRETFLRTVSRPPSEDELVKAQTDVAAAATPVEGIRELLWTMLNTREFIVNH